MSIDPTSSSTLYRRKSSKSDKHLYSRHSLKERQSKSLIHNQTLTMTEENSGDTLTDLSSLPYMPNKPESHKRHRRFSELKPNLNQTMPNKDIERRNSTPQIHFGSLLPNPFRSNRHSHRSNSKDETNTSNDNLNNSFSLWYHDSMAMKNDGLSSSRILNTSVNGSRTNLSMTSERSSNVSHEDSLSSLFTFDSPLSDEPRSAETYHLKLNISLCVAEIYREHFLEYYHTNYCGELKDEGSFIASLRYFPIKSDHSNCQARAIIRTFTGNYDVSTMIDETNEEQILPILFHKAQLSSIQISKPTSDGRANEKIYAFDKANDERQNGKIGFIYQRYEQTDESELFNNDELPTEAIDFLQILADRVRLKGFEKYRGDLDVKNDLHGEYSYYTQYNHHEIMFNVAAMIPSTNTNGQCVKRKGLVGNSFVCIVFQESDAEFIPDFISGKVTQIYITVQPMKFDEHVYYKIGIWHRNDLTSVIDPPGGIYEYDKSFRDYFLTLLLNSINVAIESPSLRFCIAEQRQRLKQEELKKLAQNLIIGQISDIQAERENTNSPLEQRSYSRTDSVTNLNIQSTNDNTITTTPTTTTPEPGRISPAPMKKRTLSKIFSALTGRSGSTLTVSNNDHSPVTPPSPETIAPLIRLVPASNKDSIKRTTSVKHRAAPIPPVSSRAPISYKYGAPPSMPHTVSQSNVLRSAGITNDSTSSQNHYLDTYGHEEAGRNRSNSSPGNSIIITKHALSNVSTTCKDISGSSSSMGDDDDSSDTEYSEDEKYEHRSTLTDISAINAKI